jgi:protein-tyrosine kinase
MQHYKMLKSGRDQHADMENSAMSDAEDQPEQPPRSRSVSLFRRDNVAVARPRMVDLAGTREAFSDFLPAIGNSPARVWDSLVPAVLNADHLIGNGLFSNVSSDPAATAFDILRTRLLGALAEKHWRRVAVTAPTRGCGTSLVAANLALSLARRPESRTVLMDFDLRRPGLARLLGVTDVQPLTEFLTGEQPLEAMFHRVGRSLALGLNSQPVEDAAARLLDPDTASALEAMLDQLDPDVAIYDLPPALASDDVMAMAANVDCVLLVCDGTRTSPDDIRACERLFAGRLPLMGVVLNRGQDRRPRRYLGG